MVLEEEWFSAYINEACSHRIIPQEKAVELVKKYQEYDDINAMNELILCNQRLVLHFVKKTNYSMKNSMWMICCGNDGLREAIERYNPEKSAFSTFAGKMIKWSIKAGLKDEVMTSIPVPAIRFEKIKKLESLIHEYAFKDETLTDKIIAERIGCSVGTAKNVRVDYNTYFRKGRKMLYPSLIEEPKKEDTEELIDIMLKGLAELPKKYRSALEMFYGINCKKKTLNNIGKKFVDKGYIRPRRDINLSSLGSRAGQIKNEAFEMLKEYML
ncbi:hypothetical protein GF361_03135, partial [Candidatus Woesearchaeota archaeon]|nr:hypothetical protein [Candidatus Woesearchaeota archaeon]